MAAEPINSTMQMIPNAPASYAKKYGQLGP